MRVPIALALIVGLPLGVLAESSDRTQGARAAPGAATDATAPSDDAELDVVSGDELTLLTASNAKETYKASDTKAVGRFVLDTVCPPGITVVKIASDGAESELEPDPKSYPNTGSSTGAGQCVTTVTTMVSPASAATGWLVISAPNYKSTTIDYKVVRTSRFSVYKFAAAAGGIAAGLTLILLLLTLLKWTGHGALVFDKRIPSEWKVEDAYVTGLTALAAGAASLLTITGVLDEYAPQYRLGGVLAGNFIVTLVLLLPPLLFGILRRDDDPRGGHWIFIFATALTISAAVTQLALIDVVLLNGSMNGGARTAVTVTGAVLACLLIAYAVVYPQRFPGRDDDTQKPKRSGST